jgi:hypothetical protein
MALEAQVRINQSDEEALIWQSWATASYAQSTKQTLALTTTKTEIKTPLSSIAFAYVAKAAVNDTAVVSVFKESEAYPMLTLTEFFVTMGISLTKLELQASAATNLEIFVAGT